MFDRLSEFLTSMGHPVKTVGGVIGAAVLTFRDGVTQQQIDACNADLATFDWSQATHDAWVLAKLHPQASELMDGINQLGLILRALVGVLLDELNTLRGQIVGVATAVWDPANMANASGVTSPNVTVNGAAFGDVVDVVAPYTLQGITATAYVSAANTVNVRLHNGTGGAINLASGTWGVCVRRHTALPARTLAQARAAIISKIDAGEVDS